MSVIKTMYKVFPSKQPTLFYQHLLTFFNNSCSYFMKSPSGALLQFGDILRVLSLSFQSQLQANKKSKNWDLPGTA